MLTQVLTYLPRVTKALVALALAASGAYATALKDGVTADEWIVVVAAAVAAGIGTWLVPNKPAAA